MNVPSVDSISLQDATNLDVVRQLVIEACKHPTGSTERRKSLTKIIRLISKKLWKEDTPYYEDALQQTWIFFCHNICEGKTCEPYDPNRSSVITWLNTYLKRRLQDGYLEYKKQQTRTVSHRVRPQGSSYIDETIDPVENLEASQDVPSILEEVKRWATNDAKGELRRIHIQGHPEVNCQVLILRRLASETSWKNLAAEFGLSIPTLSSFYQRQCLPRLREFGESNGYLG